MGDDVLQLVLEVGFLCQIRSAAIKSYYNGGFTWVICRSTIRDDVLGMKPAWASRYYCGYSVACDLQLLSLSREPVPNPTSSLSNLPSESVRGHSPASMEAHLTVHFYPKVSLYSQYSNA